MLVKQDVITLMHSVYLMRMGDVTICQRIVEMNAVIFVKELDIK